jgi:DNA-binding transcriptional LysR family regulator
MWHGPQDHLNRWPFTIDGKLQEFAARGNFSSSNGQTLFQLCIAGVGIMRCAEHLALPAITAGTLVPLLAQFQGNDDTAIHAVLLPERQLLPRVRAFVDHFVGVFREPPWVA